MLQDTLGNLWPRYADFSWKPASWSASAMVVATAQEKQAVREFESHPT
jgi:hypothetical protein